jgi:hypothetical protein
MFIELLVASAASRRPMITCPSCAGYGFTGHDEEGREYTCYRCFATGSVDKAAAEMEAADEARAEAEYAAAEAAKRAALGVPEGFGYYIDEYEGEVVLIPPRAARAPAPAVDFDDDIPF